MKPQKEPIHMNAKKGDIAPLVVMPGDPLRAKYIADNFLENAREVTNVRNMLGFTGTYKGKSITVMGHGMGMPSAAIYFFELFYFYDVQKIIRIGTAGALDPKVDLLDIMLADKVYTEANFAKSFNGFEGNVVIPSISLTNTIYNVAKEKGLSVIKGTIMTTDVFGPYALEEEMMARVPKDIHPLGEEMESFALVHVANSFNREAAAIITAVDSKFTDKVVSAKDRQTSLNDMIGLALDAIIQ